MRGSKTQFFMVTRCIVYFDNSNSRFSIVEGGWGGEVYTPSEFHCLFQRMFVMQNEMKLKLFYNNLCTFL